LEKLVGEFEVSSVFEFLVLASYRMNNTLDNIIPWYECLQILNQFVGLFYIIVFQIIDNQIKPGFWENINKWGKNLKSIFATSKHNQIMAE
jgi:hypothetical protein